MNKNTSFHLHPRKCCSSCTFSINISHIFAPVVMQALSFLILLVYLPSPAVVISQPFCLSSLSFPLLCGFWRIVDLTVTLWLSGPLRVHLHGSCCLHLQSVLPAPGHLSCGVAALGADVFDATCRGKASKVTPWRRCQLRGKPGPPGSEKLDQSRSFPELWRIQPVFT